MTRLGDEQARCDQEGLCPIVLLPTLQRGDVGRELERRRSSQSGIDLFKCIVRAPEEEQEKRLPPVTRRESPVRDCC